jgi:hypothetical protein
MDATVAALLGAIIGGGLSVLASWLAQRVQSRSNWLAQEIRQRQELYSEFVESAARSYGDALQADEPNTSRLTKLYGDIGRIRLHSSEKVVLEAGRIAHMILDTYGGANRSKREIRDFLAHDSVDLFSDFSDACREELARLQPLRVGLEGPLHFRITPNPDAAASGQN